MTAFGNYMPSQPSGQDSSRESSLPQANDRQQNRDFTNEADKRAADAGSAKIQPGTLRGLSASMAEQAWAFSPANFQTQNSDADSTQGAGAGKAAPSGAELPASGYGAGARARMEREQTIPPQSYTNEMVPHQERTAAIAAPVVTASTAPVGETKTLRSILPKSAFGTKPASSAKKVAVDATAISETFANNWTAPQPTPASDTGPNAVVLPTHEQSQAATAALPAQPVVHMEKRSGAIGAFIQAKQAETGDNHPQLSIKPQPATPSEMSQASAAAQSAQGTPLDRPITPAAPVKSATTLPPVPKNPDISQFNAPVPYSQTEAQAPSAADIARAFAPYVAAQQAQEAPRHPSVHHPVPAGLMQPNLMQPNIMQPNIMPANAGQPGLGQQNLEQQNRNQQPAAHEGIRAPLPVAPAAYEQPLRPPSQEQQANNAAGSANANKDVKNHPLFANLATRPADTTSDAYNARMGKQTSTEDLSKQVIQGENRSSAPRPVSAVVTPDVVAAPVPVQQHHQQPQEDPFACDNCYQSMEISPDGVVKTTITLPDLSSSKIETRNPDKSWAIALTDHLSRPTIEQRFDKNNQLVMQTNSRFDHVDAPMMPSHKIVKTATQTIETTLDQNGIVMHSKVLPSSDLSTSKIIG